MKNLVTYFCGFLLAATVARAQHFNRPVPSQLFPYKFTSNKSTSYFYLTSPFKLDADTASPTFKSSSPTLLDSNGYVFWFTHNNATNNGNFKYFPKDSVLSFTRTDNGISYYHILDLHFNQVAMLTNAIGVQADAHDFQILSNGNYLMGGKKDSIMNLSGYTFNGVKGDAKTVVVACILQEFDPSFNLVFEWNSLDHIHPSKCIAKTYPYKPTKFDYCHYNAVEEDQDGNWLISFKNLDAIYKIDHSTGKVIWSFGGSSNQFTFTNDIGFSGQHDIRILPNGNLSLFDNANSASKPQKSRAVEYTLDTFKHTATKTWEYIHTPAFFAKAMGNHQITLPEDHLVNYGIIFRPNPNMELLNDHLNIISKLEYEDSVMNYRIHVAEIPFQIIQPQIDCHNNGLGVFLTAPPGYTNYEWSTGETSQTIFIMSPGTYQVWVNFGIGMLGSQPLIIDNIGTTGIFSAEEIPAEIPIKISAYFNVFGQPVIEPTPGNVYFTLDINGKRSVRYIAN